MKMKGPSRASRAFALCCLPYFSGHTCGAPETSVPTTFRANHYDTNQKFYSGQPQHMSYMPGPVGCDGWFRYTAADCVSPPAALIVCALSMGSYMIDLIRRKGKKSQTDPQQTFSSTEEPAKKIHSEAKGARVHRGEQTKS